MIPIPPRIVLAVRRRFTTPYLDFSLLDDIDFHSILRSISPFVARFEGRYLTYVPASLSFLSLSTLFTIYSRFEHGFRGKRSNAGVKNIAQRRSTSRQFPSSAYITHTIYLGIEVGWSRQLLSLGGGAIHHTFFFIKLIFFKKSHLSLLSRGGAASSSSSRSGAQRSGGNQLRRENEKFTRLSWIRWVWKLAWLKMIYIRTSRDDGTGTRALALPMNNLPQRSKEIDRKMFNETFLLIFQVFPLSSLSLPFSLFFSKGEISREKCVIIRSSERRSWKENFWSPISFYFRSTRPGEIGHSAAVKRKKKKRKKGEAPPLAGFQQTASLPSPWPETAAGYKAFFQFIRRRRLAGFFLY